MRCYNHESDESAAVCGCGRGLCGKCGGSTTPPRCEDCDREHVAQRRRTIWMDLALTGAAFVVGFVSLYVPGKYSALSWHAIKPGLIMGYMLSSAWAGWITINRFTNARLGTVVAVPIIGWIFILGFKFVAAMAIGVIALPLQTALRLLELRRISALRLEALPDFDSGLRLVHGEGPE
jgi:hypothetical protein